MRGVLHCSPLEPTTTAVHPSTHVSVSLSPQATSLPSGLQTIKIPRRKTPPYNARGDPQENNGPPQIHTAQNTLTGPALIHSNSRAGAYTGFLLLIHYQTPARKGKIQITHLSHNAVHVHCLVEPYRWNRRRLRLARRGRVFSQPAAPRSTRAAVQNERTRIVAGRHWAVVNAVWSLTVVCGQIERRQAVVTTRSTIDRHGLRNRSGHGFYGAKRRLRVLRERRVAGLIDANTRDRVLQI
jgi:hypothetical protein